MYIKANWMFFVELAMGLPTLLVCLAAYVVCRLRWKQTPRPALFCLLGFALIAMNALSGAAFWLAVENLGLRDSINVNLVQVWLRAFGDVINGAGLVLLLIAVFTERRRVMESSL